MPDNESIVAYVALGANLGDRQRNIRAALAMLSENPRVKVLQVSSLLENAAIGGPPDSPPFLNAVAEIETTLDPHELLEALLEIERRLGRVRERKWEPRIIDLDLILYSDQVIDRPDLKVPHPLMHERRFVVEPLAEIAPTVRHPVLNKSISQLASELDRSD